jgi:pyruvate kinase
MIRAGMNVARLNFSHGEFDLHRENIENIRTVAKALDQPVAIMGDLSGPKMRIGDFALETIHLKRGDRFTLTAEDVTGDQHRVSVSFSRLPSVVKPGDSLSLYDGYVNSRLRKSAALKGQGGHHRTYVRDWVRLHELSGAFAILTERRWTNDPDSNYRMEIVNL